MAFAKIISRGTSNGLPCFPVRALLFAALLLLVTLGISCGEARSQDTDDPSNPSSVLPQASSPNRASPGPDSTVSFTSSQAHVSADGDSASGGADKIPKLTVLGIPQFLDVAVVGVVDATTIRVETEDRIRDDIGLLGLQLLDDLDADASGGHPMGQRAACLRHWDRRARELAEIRLQGRTVTLLLQGSTLAELFSSGRLQSVVMLGNEDFNATMLELGLGRTSLETGDARSREYLSLQSRAQSLNKGLWGMPTTDLKSPGPSHPGPAACAFTTAGRETSGYIGPIPRHSRRSQTVPDYHPATYSGYHCHSDSGFLARACPTGNGYARAHATANSHVVTDTVTAPNA